MTTKPVESQELVERLVKRFERANPDATVWGQYGFLTAFVECLVDNVPGVGEAIQCRIDRFDKHADAIGRTHHEN